MEYDERKASHAVEAVMTVLWLGQVQEVVDWLINNPASRQSACQEAGESLADALIRVSDEGINGAVSELRLACMEAMYLLDDSAEVRAIIEKARDKYEMGSDNNVEIDDRPNISMADQGCWVQAWVWVPDGRALFVGTPKGRNRFYDLFMRGVEGGLDGQ